MIGLLGGIPKKKWLIFGIILVLVIAIAGYFFVSKKDSVSISNTIGIIDLDKAISAHPKYKQWLREKQEEEELIYEAQQETYGIMQQEQQGQSKLDGNLQDAMRKSFEEEFNSKMKAKQEELMQSIDDKVQEAKKPLQEEFENYARQVNEEYDTKLFDLHLKLKVLSVEEQQHHDIVDKINALKQEQNEKLFAKSQEIDSKLQEVLEPELSRINIEMNKYAEQLNKEIGNKMSAGAQGMFPGVSLSSESTKEIQKIENKVILKQQENKAMYDQIVHDVRHKAIEIAIKKRLNVVLTDYTVNINAIDITDLVITEIKK
ncbi:hypothetical protein LJC10_01920 [Selenomonadales bacterium OttesenSCG-928-I06]|nr:hypothetical protein [Selenomonadales bacterium OttesenSCG-928-I06]